MHARPVSMCNCNMLTCMHNISSCKHNMLNACTKCRHVICTHNMPTCMHTQYIMPLSSHNMHVRSACAMQPPGPAQRSKFMDEPTRGFLSITLWEKTLKLLRSQACLETNIRDISENHSQPAKGPGVRCIRYQGCTHRFGSSQGLQT